MEPAIAPPTTVTSGGTALHDAFSFVPGLLGHVFDLRIPTPKARTPSAAEKALGRGGQGDGREHVADRDVVVDARAFACFFLLLGGVSGQGEEDLVHVGWPSENDATPNAGVAAGCAAIASAPLLGLRALHHQRRRVRAQGAEFRVHGPGSSPPAARCSAAGAARPARRPCRRSLRLNQQSLSAILLAAVSRAIPSASWSASSQVLGAGRPVTEVLAQAARRSSHTWFGCAGPGRWSARRGTTAPG